MLHNGKKEKKCTYVGNNASWYKNIKYVNFLRYNNKKTFQYFQQQQW